MSYRPHYLQEVRRVQQESYLPCSQFEAGIYLKTKDGRTFYDTNVENFSCLLSICVERVSLVSAISQGYRPGDFESVAVIVDVDKPSSPYGVCRQVLKKLCDDDIPMCMTNHKGGIVMIIITELLPFGFLEKDLEWTTECESGFVSVIGRPDVRKLILVNRMIGHKIVVMSGRAQITRNKIQGVMTRDDAQIIFIDTPGTHKPKHKLGNYMMKVAKNALSEVDAIMPMINTSKEIGRGDEYIIEILKGVKTSASLVLNKTDLMHPDGLMPKIEEYQSYMDFIEIVPISVLEGLNVGHSIDVLKTYLPEGPKYHPDDQISDHPEQFVVGEIIRKKILHLTSEEIPHATDVNVDRMAKKSEDRVHVEVTIYVERDSQKRIVIGKGGKKLKEVGKRMRRDIEIFLGSKVYLEL